MAPTVEAMQAGPAHDILHHLISTKNAVANIAAHAHSHSHAADATGHGSGLDPNAAWFALASVLCKEWLYRITKKVAREERSPVLHANALHHRSDAYTSAVALAAIVGHVWLPTLPLDPLGGELSASYGMRTN